MTPGAKRTIITSKTTGRRYFLIRSASRPSGRRYYVCTNPTCKMRVPRESDLYCRAHAPQEQAEGEDIADISAKSDPIDENDIQENGEVIEEETPAIAQESIETESIHNEQQQENGNNDSINGDEIHESNEYISTNISMPLSPHSQLNREVHVNELTGARTFRDSSGRRRYLCTDPSCKTMLKRQLDLYCSAHSISQGLNKKNRRSQKRHSTSSSSNQSKKNRYRSPFVTAPVPTMTTEENDTNENQSDEYETPKIINPQRTGTNRSFRDASGKLRFLCSIPTCISRVPRQSDYYCKRHQQEARAKESENNQSEVTNGNIHDEKVNGNQEMIVEANETNTAPRQTASEIPAVQSESKKRKRESSITLSSIPIHKMVIATTTLLDDQWSDLLSFLHQFPEVQLSTNLNINNTTTHLLVDDSENLLHCTITKKIVQAAVRRHIFIISSRWLNECMRLNKFIDEHPYEIISDSHTTLRLSIQNSTATNKYLFCPTLQFVYAFSIECRQCQGSINRGELIELIQLTGAQLFQNEQAVDILIVLCDTNEKNLNKIKEKYLQAPASNIKYVTSDFLLKSIIKFEIQDIEKYSL